MSESSLLKSDVDFVLCFLDTLEEVEINPFGNEICLPYSLPRLGVWVLLVGWYSTSTSISRLFSMLASGITIIKMIIPCYIL